MLSVKKIQKIGPEITAKQQERVNTLMAEALQETVNIASESEPDDLNELKLNDRGVEVFFFPDETQQLKKLKEEKQDDMSISDSSSTLKPSTSTTTTMTFEGKRSDISPSTKEVISNTSKSDPDEWNFDINRDSETDSNELKDLLNFETSVMCKSYNVHEEAVEALPQIRQELGEVNYNIQSKQANERQSRKNSFTIEDDFYFIPDEDKTYMVKS